MKMCSNILVIREVQIKNYNDSTQTPIKIDTCKRPIIPSVVKALEQP